MSSPHFYILLSLLHANFIENRNVKVGDSNPPATLLSHGIGLLFVRGTCLLAYFQGIESLINNWIVTGVVGPGGNWGQVQGVGPDHQGTRSQC